MCRVALYVGIFPVPALAFPQHHLGSAPLALPRIKSQNRKQVPLKRAPPLQAVHPVATARGAENHFSRSTHLNYYSLPAFPLRSPQPRCSLKLRLRFAVTGTASSFVSVLLGRPSPNALAKLIGA